MMIRGREPRVPNELLLLYLIAFTLFPEFLSSAVISLDSIVIFRTHEWLPSKPTVYFQCKGENGTVLPDVEEKNLLYVFKGEESWQPLTEIHDIKCKRCGFYEKDILLSDDVFDEWEVCASDFKSPDGKYVHFKEKELNVTFLCPGCISLGTPSSNHSSEPSRSNGGRTHLVLIVVVSVLASCTFVIGVVAACKYWEKRKRQQEQAKFLKLFEEVDDLEDELGIGPLHRVV